MYVPPSLRNKAPESTMQNVRRNNNYRYKYRRAEPSPVKEDLTKPITLETDDHSFPSLGNSAAAPKVWGGRKFAELATEWKSEDDQKKAEKELEKKGETFEFALPKFNNVHHFHEPEDEEYQEEQTEAQAEDEWVEVKKKVRVKKSVLDYTEKDFEKEGEGKDDTVWGDNREEYETCWDERRY